MPLRCGIGDDAILPDDGGLCQPRRLHLTLAHDVGHGVACGEEVVGDDLAMAAAPRRLGAHDGTAARLAERLKLPKAGPECRRRRVIGVVAEILVFPKAIGRRALVLAPAPQTSEFGDSLVRDPDGSQWLLQRIRIELRIVPRFRDGAHVDDLVHACFLQKLDELAQGPVRMADREKLGQGVSQDGDLPV